jgi:hypothetical protein
MDILGSGRLGACHRCGWAGTVGKVRRRDRKRLLSGVTYGRLCPDCVADLLQGQSAAAPATHVELKSVKYRHRDVA